MKSIKSIRRGELWTILILTFFMLGMVLLVVRVVVQAPFYMSHSADATLGRIVDRRGEILFDPTATSETYGNQFDDIGNLIGDTRGIMDNTLVACNRDKLANYSLIFGAAPFGETALHCTLDHGANRAVHDAFGSKDGAAIAFNYQTGEILICVSRPNIDPLNYYEHIEELPSGSLLSKAFARTVPGSTQKILTTAAAMRQFGSNALVDNNDTRFIFSCEGEYETPRNQKIICHYKSGHGTQNLLQAFENSCNPYFAQLVQTLDINSLTESYRQYGVSVNGDEPGLIEVDGIQGFTASAQLMSVQDFDTIWNCMGQSEALASPIQMMLWESAIAKGDGIVTKPYLIESADDLYGEEVYRVIREDGSRIFAPDIAVTIKEIMKRNAQERYAFGSYPVGVKSGTAQVAGDKENTLLVGFNDDPALPVAFCVVVENNAEKSIDTEDIVNTMLNALSR